MTAFPARRLAGDIDEHREAHGVEPICGVLPAKSQGDLREIAPSTCHEHMARRADPSRVPPRAKSGAELRREVQRVLEENLCVYGVRKAWRQLQREGVPAARWPG